MKKCEYCGSEKTNFSKPAKWNKLKNPSEKWYHINGKIACSKCYGKKRYSLGINYYTPSEFEEKAIEMLRSL